MAPGLGTSRRAPQGLTAPWRAVSRRWIDTARGPSISCSQIAHASASNGSGRRRGRSQGLRRRIGPSSGSRQNARWNSDRSWSVPSAKRIRCTAAVAHSSSSASARRRTPPLVGHARTVAGAPPRAGTGSAPRRAVASPRRDPRPASGRRRRARLPARRRAVSASEVDVDQERAGGLHVHARAASPRAGRACARASAAGGRAPQHLQQHERRDAEHEAACGGHHGGRARRPAWAGRAPSPSGSTGTGRCRTSATTSPSRASESSRRWSAGSGIGGRV